MTGMTLKPSGPNGTGGFCFVDTGEKSYFLHRSSCPRWNIPFHRIEFDLAPDERGREHCVNVTILGPVESYHATGTLTPCKGQFRFIQIEGRRVFAHQSDFQCAFGLESGTGVSCDVLEWPRKRAINICEA